MSKHECCARKPDRVFAVGQANPVANSLTPPAFMERPVFTPINVVGSV
jgi:hypothetical protein